MKTLRILAAILLTAMLLTCLCGCVRYEAPNGNVYDNNAPWREDSYTLDSGESVLEYDGVKYEYEVLRQGKRITYTVTYPNGAVYTETREGDSVQSHWEGGRDPIQHTGSDTLVNILDDYYYVQVLKPHFLNWIGALVLISFGLFGALCPEAAWELEHALKRWQYQSIEPTDDAILMTRFGGILGIVVGVIFFFVGWR